MAEKTAGVEASKTTLRMAIVGAIAVIVTYVVNRFFPGTPENVVAAILFLAGVAFDNYQHHAGKTLKIPV